MRKYKIDILNYTTNGGVKSDCADITFFNNGLAPVTINAGLILFAGQSISFTANAGEIDTTIYNFSFGVGASNNLIVFRKIYA